MGTGGSAFAPPLRAQDDLMLRRRPPKAWNESDLDVAYEKKSSQTASYERLDVFARPSSPSLQLLPWRESSLDGLGASSKAPPSPLLSWILNQSWRVCWHQCWRLAMQMRVL